MQFHIIYCIYMSFLSNTYVCNAPVNKDVYSEKDTPPKILSQYSFFFQ